MLYQLLRSSHKCINSRYINKKKRIGDVIKIFSRITRKFALITILFTRGVLSTSRVRSSHMYHARCSFHTAYSMEKRDDCEKFNFIPWSISRDRIKRKLAFGML